MGKVGRKRRGGIKVRKGRSDGEGREQRGKRLRRVREEGGSGNGGVTEY